MANSNPIIVPSTPAVTQPGLVLLAVVTPDATTGVMKIPLGGYTGYYNFVLEINSLIPTNSGNAYPLQVSTNNGASFVATLNVQATWQVGGVVGNYQNGASIQVNIGNNVQKVTAGGRNLGLSGTVRVFMPSDATSCFMLTGQTMFRDQSGGASAMATFGAYNDSLTAVNYLEINGAPAPFLSGTVRVYGEKPTV